jgi:hypothetical protein
VTAQSSIQQSWLPEDLTAVLVAPQEAERPSLLLREDDRGLLYAGRLHSFAGEPESGKSWLAQVAVAERLLEGAGVVYLDFEDAASSMVSRLRSLGCEPDGIRDRLRFVRPSEPLIGPLPDELLDPAPALVVIDGVTEAFALLGRNVNDNTEAAELIALLARPFTTLGAAVVMIDHVVKGQDRNARYAIGAQHKLAAVDGAAYMLRQVSPFARGRRGVARIEVVKDRPGGVREFASGKVAGELILEPDGNRLRATVRPSATGGEQTSFRPTTLMERISRYLEDIDEEDACSLREILSAVHGKSEYVQQALRILVDEGYVRRSDGPRASHLHRSVRAYRA